jgi:hypothetical protein
MIWDHLHVSFNYKKCFQLLKYLYHFNIFLIKFSPFFILAWERKKSWVAPIVEVRKKCKYFCYACNLGSNVKQIFRTFKIASNCFWEKKSFIEKKLI